jgi:Ca2+-binding RTX toxin-like protein
LTNSHTLAAQDDNGLAFSGFLADASGHAPSVLVADAYAGTDAINTSGDANLKAIISLLGDSLTITGNHSVFVTTDNTPATITLNDTGNDVVVAGNGGDHITGGAGQDTLIGGTGADTLTLGSGNGSVAIAGGTDTGLNTGTGTGQMLYAGPRRLCDTQQQRRAA